MSKLPRGWPPAGRNKYRAKRTEYNGVVYASKAEAARAAYHDDSARLGLIRFWVPQPAFRLGCPENLYRADFLVIGDLDFVWVEDVKGVETAKFRRDKKLWAAYGPCNLLVIRNGKVVDTVVGGGRKPAAGPTARAIPADSPEGIELLRKQGGLIG